MAETYVTYLVWDGCRAPGNLEYNGRLCGQRVREVSFDRDALLALADEMETDGTDCYTVSTQYVLDDYAQRIREACGVSE